MPLATGRIREGRQQDGCAPLAISNEDKKAGGSGQRLDPGTARASTKAASRRQFHRSSRGYWGSAGLALGLQCMSRNSPTPNAGPNNVDTTTNNMGLSTMVLTPQTQSRAEPTRYPQNDAN
jgi:hypothetical protein